MFVGETLFDERKFAMDPIYSSHVDIVFRVVFLQPCRQLALDGKRCMLPLGHHTAAHEARSMNEAIVPRINIRRLWYIGKADSFGRIQLGRTFHRHWTYHPPPSPNAMRSDVVSVARRRRTFESDDFSLFLFLSAVTTTMRILSRDIPFHRHTMIPSGISATVNSSPPR